MSHKNLAMGTLLVMTFFLCVVAFVTTSYVTLQSIDPLAALTALIVAVVGFAWFKKSNG
jgi:UDP-N-acetylmuramyl pentapeptide phosphotransferase/UDP-N-acetylglucosamine-1-phosphate transferase